MTMAIKMFETMGGVTIVTPPSMLNPEKISFAILNLREETINQFAIQLNKVFPNDIITVFVWNGAGATEGWLRQALEKARFVVKSQVPMPEFVKEELKKANVYEVTSEQSVEQTFQNIKKDHFEE